MDSQPEDQQSLYIAMLSIHGLVRGTEIELGRDADTGGQVKYVIDLAKALSDHENIERVDLFTRQIFDKKVDEEYAEPIEQLADKAFLVRIPCGPKTYLRKEVLWPYMGEFADNILQHFRQVGMVPDLIHGHYADAGMVGSQLAGVLGVPFAFTGHSLGKAKVERLKEKGMTFESIEKKFNITQRIEAEEMALDAARMVVTSTQQEKDEQYAVYEGHRKTRTIVIPPGVLLDDFFPSKMLQGRPPIFNKIGRFLDEPKKPMILALSRADERKNIATLVKAYGESEKLQELANLVLFLGTRNQIREMESGPRKVFKKLLLDIDKYDLYGKIAIPKNHEASDVPHIYRLAARSKGIFINPALTEPFGLTLLEAAASGLPVVATEDGGPKEILAKCKNGLLVDPMDSDAIAGSLISALTDRRRWNRWSKNGIKFSKKYYTWSGHADRYMDEVVKINRSWQHRIHKSIDRSRLPVLDRLIITDLDGTLFGDKEGLQNLLSQLEEAGDKVGLAIATGRRIDSAVRALKKWGVPTPDILITAVGSEIHYGKQTAKDQVWTRHINYRWRPDEILEAMSELPGLKLQPKTEQREHKISYYHDPDKGPTRNEIVRHLRSRKLSVQVIYSLGRYLDILPFRASKGAAVRYLAIKWGLPIDRILVAGDSGNDLNMLKVSSLGVVVGNYSPELESMKSSPNVYFASKPNAWGIIEGIEHYGFFSNQ